jgi:hypothetical protein
MSTHAEALPSDNNNGRLALALGLLGIPGSTIAWSLPAGGFWIGVPLAVAAIVLGRRAGGRAGTAGIVLGAAEILLMAVWTIAS